MENQQKKSGNKGLIIFLIIVILAMGGGLAYLYLDIQEKEEELTQFSEIVQEQDDEITTKVSELKDLKSEYERIRQERASLDKYIKDLEKSTRINSQKRKELEHIIANLKKDLAKKDEQIAHLEVVQDSLETNVEFLTVEKTKMSDTLSTVRDELAYASILKADDVKTIFVKENGKEIDDKYEYKGKKIDFVKISR